MDLEAAVPVKLRSNWRSWSALTLFVSLGIIGLVHYPLGKSMGNPLA